MSHCLKNLFSLKPKNKNQLKRSCTVLQSFCKSKFTQLCINYRGAHPRNTIALTTPKLFKEKLKGTLVEI